MPLRFFRKENLIKLAYTSLKMGHCVGKTRLIPCNYIYNFTYKECDLLVN